MHLLLHSVVPSNLTPGLALQTQPACVTVLKQRTGAGSQVIVNAAASAVDVEVQLQARSSLNQAALVI